MDVVVLGNFNVIEREVVPGFTQTGKWYEFYTGDSLMVLNINDQLDFQPGEYRLYTTRKLPKPVFTGIGDPATDPGGNPLKATFFPNPTDGWITIESAESHLEVTLLDQSGRILFIRRYADPGITNLNLEFLKPGLYFIRLGVQGKVPFTGKLVIQ